MRDGTPTAMPPPVGPPHEAAAAADRVAARPSVQPPPAEWGPEQDGPGSPAGSVRPPDIAAAYDPAARGRVDAGRGSRTIAPALIGALVGGMLGTAGTLAVIRATPAFEGTRAVAAPVVQVAAGADGTTIGTSVVSAVAEAVTPSVVRIDVRVSDSTLPEGAIRSGIGSGVIYRSDGYILTNHHVVSDASEVRVRLASGEQVAAEVIGSDELNDLAVLKVARRDLPAINLRDEALRVGETAIAIGSPFGLDASVTAGVVSAINRDIQVPGEEGALVIPSVVQTDAAINPGNSGGALVDAQGRLIGINTAILTRTGGSQGVGFAIAATSAVPSADQLIELGYVRHPFLGITGVDLTPHVAERFGIDADGGAVVENISPGTGAAAAGLRSNDIIIAVDGEPIRTMSDLVVEIRRRAPGDEMELTVIRDGRRLRLTVELGERPS